MIYTTKLNTPLILTLIRLILSPLLVPALFVLLLPANIFWINLCLAGLFVIFGLTDFFDGFFARRLQQETLLGKLLDPIADKFLLYSTLIALLVVSKIFFYWVIILIGREFLVMGLRLIAVEHHFSIAVSSLAKAKTALYTICLTIVIANPYQQLGLSGAPWWNGTEYVATAMAVFVACLSGWRYYQFFIVSYVSSKV